MSAVPPPTIRVGVVGTGFVARHFALAARGQPDVAVAAMLTRRRPADCGDVPDPSLLTNSADALLDAADVVFECSGDPLHAADVIDRALDRGLPVMTLNAEFHVTAGSYFAGRGVLTEAEGDQPGCLAALAEEAVAMGFRPRIFAAVKGFLNHDPTPEEMAYWGDRQGISLPMVTAATDGTKLQIEQALVANGLSAGIAREGLLGPATDDLRQGAAVLADAARAHGGAISDYLLSPALPHGVFLVAGHDDAQRAALAYVKAGDGPDYVLLKPHVFAHLEVAKTARRLAAAGGVLLDNGAAPTVGVAAVAKRDMPAGHRIARAIGSFDLRGVAVEIAARPDHVPIGLIAGAVTRRPIARGEVVGVDALDLPDSLALTAWRSVAATAAAAPTTTAAVAP